MELEPSLRYAVGRVRDALGRYAESKGWRPQDYYIFMVVNTSWGIITAELVSDAFERSKIDRFEYLDDVMDFLEGELRDVPEVYEALGITLSPLRGYAFQLDRDFGKDTVEIDDEYLNPGKPPLRVPPSTHSR